MSLLDDPTEVLSRLIAPELRELNARLDKLESQVLENEQRTTKQHEELLYAIRRLTDWTASQDRQSRRGGSVMPIE